MKPIEIRRIADDALQFDDIMKHEFGAGLTLGHTPLPAGDELMPLALIGVITKTNSFPAENFHSAYTAKYTVIPASLNLANLKAGMGFGLLTSNGVAPAVISPRSNAQELHVLYLRDETIIPQNVGRIGFEPSELQRSVLQGINPFQDRNVGGHAADASASVASEGGHSMLGLKGLTDMNIKATIFDGKHVVHTVAETPKGIIPTFAQPSSSGYGMFSTENRSLVPNEKIITSLKGAFLIDHPHYRSISLPVEELTASPELIVMGIGMIAAKSQLNKNDSELRDDLLTVLDSI